MGHRPDNPAGDSLGQALGRQQAIVQHMRALPTARWWTPSRPCEPPRPRFTTKRAFEFLVLTAARSGALVR